MRVEVVAVGTELLLGDVVDTNSAWIGQRLALAGIDAHFQTRVGDNIERIATAVRVALDRSDAVVVCGGLGPTHDDVTREALALLLGVELVTDEVVLERIRELFDRRGRSMAATNARQAQVPAGATVIDQRRGTAPGLICPFPSGDGGKGDGGKGDGGKGDGGKGDGGKGDGGKGDGGRGKVVYAVPGVPHEMTEMVARAVIPDLEARRERSAAIVSRVLRTWGESESALAELVGPRIAALEPAGNPTIAFLASGMEGIKVRITAKGDTPGAAEAMVDDEEANLRRLLGFRVFAVDDVTMEAVVGQMLEACGLTLGLAESMTGGLIASRCSEVPGCSTWFRGGVVSYDSQVKFDLLDVPEGPVVSARAAAAMAENVRKVLEADVGLSVTGVAGPTEQDGMPVGKVFVGLALGQPGSGDDGGPAVDTEVTELQLAGDRAAIRQAAATSVLDRLRLRLADMAGRELAEEMGRRRPS